MHELLRLLMPLADGNAFPGGLATVVATEGSSYRRPGARMLLSPTGQRTGAISGGCLEEDLVHHLRAVMADGQARNVVYDTTAENDLLWGVGLGCNGRVTLLLERLEARPPAVAFAYAAADQRRVGCVLATVYDATERSLLGTRVGLAGDGAEWSIPTPEPWRAAFTRAAASTLAAQASQRTRFPELAGAPAVFLEYIPPTPQLLILGAGDDAQDLAHAAADLGWAVLVADPRPAFATPARFPRARRVVVQPPGNLRGTFALDAHTFAVVMTHHYVHDLPYLGELIGEPLAYLGLLGPKKRAERLLDELSTRGRTPTPEQRARLHAPVGLDLGGDAPPAVALSILAEMQTVLHRRSGGPLRDRVRPIHEP